MRSEVNEFQGIAAARLEVHGLPHSPRFAVALLSLELEGVGRVVHADHEPPAFAGTRRCQLEGERGVTALVLAQLVAIEPRLHVGVRQLLDVLLEELRIDLQLAYAEEALQPV